MNAQGQAKLADSPDILNVIPYYRHVITNVGSPVWITHLPTPQGCGQTCGFMSYPDLELTRSPSLPNILVKMNPKYPSSESIPNAGALFSDGATPRD